MTQAPVPVVVSEGGNVDFSSYASSLDSCLKEAYHFSGTTYQNICDGTSYFIANGFWDYALGFTLLGIGVAFVLMLFGMGFKVFFDSY